MFAGKLLGASARTIRTAKSSPRRLQKVKRRQRVLMARKKRVARAAASAVKLLLFGVAVAVLTVDVLDYLHSSPKFSIAHIAVNGNTHVTACEIIAKSGIVEEENIFGVNVRISAAAIREIPWMRDARIQRRFPDEIHIETVERRPVALVLLRELFYIDGEGKVLAKFDCSDGPDVPVITAKALAEAKPGDSISIEGITEALEIAQIINAMDASEKIRISEINVDDPSNILMIAEQSGANIFMGSGDLQGKLWRLAKIAEAIHQNKRFHTANLERIDMRFGAIIPAKFKDS
ncbi:MAG: FtsQ-type POTRA domain-containing protein [Candidatus Hydrogenedentota bacterium]|nr:MAG: FtsQ-type POTRA domain-containing protein [Candidatus Hydrogenedentota bacterium]